MTDKPTDLIAQAEALAGCRWDDADNPNALFALFGAVAREMGRNPHGPRDDVAAGTILAHQCSEAGRREAQRKAELDAMLLALFDAGLGPDSVADLLGRK